MNLEKQSWKKIKEQLFKIGTDEKNPLETDVEVSENSSDSLRACKNIGDKLSEIVSIHAHVIFIRILLITCFVQIT